MKKFWKFLGVTALAAALLPYRVEKDDETGDLTFDALLWQGKRSTRGGGTNIQVNFAPWFSPNRTDDLDEFEPEDPEDDLYEEPDALDEDFADLDEPELRVDCGPNLEITVTVTPDEPQAPAEPTSPEA